MLMQRDKRRSKLIESVRHAYHAVPEASICKRTLAGMKLFFFRIFRFPKTVRTFRYQRAKLGLSANLIVASCSSICRARLYVTAAASIFKWLDVDDTVNLRGEFWSINAWESALHGVLRSVMGNNVTALCRYWATQVADIIHTRKAALGEASKRREMSGAVIRVSRVKNTPGIPRGD